MARISTRALLIGTAFTAAIASACGGDSGGGGGGGGATGGATNKIDACAVVTQDDATKLFGQPAEKDTATPVTTADMIGECIWTHADAQNNSHLLQLSVWKGKQYYTPDSQATPFSVGDEGVVKTSTTWGVDVDWRQGEFVGALSYSTVGISPDATSKLEDVKTLALAAAAKLPH